MKLLLALLIFISVGSANAAMTGSVVKCTGALKGIYALDYLRMVKESGTPPVVAKGAFYELAAVVQFSGLYAMSQSAHHFFMTSSSRPNDFNRFNVWQEAAFGFEPFPLDNFAAYIPANCKPADNALIPTFVMNNSPNNRIVAFDPKIVNELNTNNPVQLQILAARLWLSEFTDDEELIYAINRLWHLKDLVENKPALEELRQLFLQLSLSPKSSDIVCERSQFILEAFKRTLHKNCGQITPADLASIESLEILDKDRMVTDFAQFDLRKIDLGGLTSLRSFKATDIVWISIAMSEGYFANVRTLEHLDLSKIGLSVWLQGLLPQHKSLLSLNLSHNWSAERIEPGFFKDVFTADPDADTTLLFNANSVEKLTSDNMEGLEHLKRLSLANTSAQEMDLSNLRRLRELDLTNTKAESIIVKSSDFPELKKLTISKLHRGNNIQMQGSWPQLEFLDLSDSGSNVLPSGINFSTFPNLRFLDLSGNGFMTSFIHKGVENSGFSKLTQLEHVRFLSTDFVGQDGSELVGKLLGEQLPPNVKVVEFCTQRTSDMMFYARSYMRKVMTERPYLKVRTKLRCMDDEEWIDVTL